jgi:hypothetical protein
MDIKAITALLGLVTNAFGIRLHYYKVGVA